MTVHISITFIDNEHGTKTFNNLIELIGKTMIHYS